MIIRNCETYSTVILQYTLTNLYHRMAMETGVRLTCTNSMSYQKGARHRVPDTFSLFIILQRLLDCLEEVAVFLEGRKFGMICLDLLC